MAAKLPEKDMNELKEKVLIGRVDYLSAELGDPSRYFPALRAKGVLLPEDSEKIKAKVTSSEKVYEMIELIHKRHSERDGHAMDVLIEALRKQRVQAHIARELQRALARAIKDQKKEVGADAASSSSLSTTPATVSQSLTNLTTPTSAVTTPTTSAVNFTPSTSQFDVHPQFGILPPPHPSKTAPSTPAQLSVDSDPRFGPLPGLPPPRQGTLRPTQEERASPGMGEVATGMSGLHLHSSVSDVTASMNTYSQYQNGEHQMPSSVGDRRYSDTSYATTSVYSMSSTEQSGLEYPQVHDEVRGQGEYSSTVQEAKYDQEMTQLRKENAYLNKKCRELADQNNDVKKLYMQMHEKVKQMQMEQKHLRESYKSGKHGDESREDQLVRQLQEKDKVIADLTRQLERYQQDNQQLQLSAAINSSRPQHLPIGIPAGRAPPYPQSRSPFHAGLGETPSHARSPFQAGVGDAVAPAGTTPGITPSRITRVGDSLNQHNIHLQHSPRSTGPRCEAYSPSAGKDSGKAVFSPGREGKGALFSPGSAGKRLSGGSGDTPVGDGYFQSSSSSLNSSGSKGSTGVTLQATPNAEQHSTMV